MVWLKSNWRWAALNLVALSVLAFLLTHGSVAWDAATFDPGLESGKWAIRLLLTCLAMSPMTTFFGWSGASKLRKPAGLWAFAFAVSHVLFYIIDGGLSWLTFAMQPFLALGLLGMIILTALAVTSNRFAMRRLQKNWKRLHRFVYLAGTAVALHAILATTASKKLAVRDAHAIHEMQIYLAVLVVLLAVRLPIVRRILVQGLAPRRIPRQADLPITPIILPSSLPNLLPEIYAMKNGIQTAEFFREPKREDAWGRQEEIPAPTNLPLAG